MLYRWRQTTSNLSHYITNMPCPTLIMFIGNKICLQHTIITPTSSPHRGALHKLRHTPKHHQANCLRASTSVGWTWQHLLLQKDVNTDLTQCQHWHNTDKTLTGEEKFKQSFLQITKHAMTLNQVNCLEDCNAVSFSYTITYISNLCKEWQIFQKCYGVIRLFKVVTSCINLNTINDITECVRQLAAFHRSILRIT